MLAKRVKVISKRVLAVLLEVSNNDVLYNLMLVVWVTTVSKVVNVG